LNLQVEGKTKDVRDQRAKKQRNKETAKSCEAKEVPYTCRYACGMTGLGIKYLQVV